MNTTVINSEIADITHTNATESTSMNTAVKQDAGLSDNIMFFVKMSLLMAATIVALASGYISIASL